MRRILIKLILLNTLFFTAVSYAALDLELTQGLQGAVPIAIVPFAGQENSLQASNNVGAVVAADLSHSGRFKVADSNNLPQTPHDNQSVDYNFWQKKSINDLVVGKVNQLPNGRYQVVFQLIDIYAGQTRQANANFQTPVLLSEQFTVDKGSLRGVAHHISDLVYQKITGDRGIFSTKIAYVLVDRSNNRAPSYLLQVADQDGYNPHTLLTSSQPIMSPAWSPNGKSLAYVSFEGGDTAIYVQSLASGARRLVSKYPGINGAPAWSPDGSKLAVVLTKTGYPKIYVVSLASGGVTQLTEGYSIDTEPNWAPNGQSLLFTSDRGGGPEIYQINLASKQIQRLTYNGDYNARGAFTPDGNSIVMITRADGGYNIALQDLQTGRLVLLTDSGLAQSPTVAPNGKMVAYANQYDGAGVLGMSSTDGKVKLRLPAQEGTVQEPAWSPFLN